MLQAAGRNETSVDPGECLGREHHKFRGAVSKNKTKKVP